VVEEEEEEEAAAVVAAKLLRVSCTATETGTEVVTTMLCSWLRKGESLIMVAT